MSSETQRQRYAGTRTALVGVDAGKFHHVLSVRPRDGDNSKALKFAVTREGFDQAAAFIRKVVGGVDPGEILVGIEFAGNCGFTLAQYLGQLGYEVVSIRPVDTKNQKRTTHRRAVKTDAKDAETILSLLFQGAWVYFPFRDPEYAALRYLLSAVDRVTSQRSGVATRVRWALQVAFPELEAILGSQSFTKHQTPLALLDAFPGPQALLAASREEVLAVVSKASRGRLKDEFADRLIAAAESTLALQVAQDPIGRELRLLVAQLRFLGDQLDQLQELVLETLQLIPESVYVMSVPGVGPMTA
ncbi:MAG TPA: transposase, partial [Longimicrobium sp.]|nr:transposase [Longimicrobium sp.]